jgi:signal transduction histidine kinase
MPLERIIEYLSEAITESRRITKQMRPSVLDDFGLTAAFEEYIEDFQTFHPEIKLILQVSMLEEKISSDAKTVLYRVLQEALNNVGKYSKADSVEIKCQCREDRIRLQIKDNGIGFNVSEAFGGARVMEGYGLNSMRERIEICQGKFHIESAPGQGTTVIAELPYECHAPEF